MAVLYNFGNPNARKEGFNFISADKYLQDPFKAPVREVEKIQANFGIPATNAFTGGGGGGANSYPGPYGNLVTDYQTTVDNRQNRLDNPSDTFLGFKTMKNRPATEASTTLAENIGIPQEMTMMGKVQDFFTPQSAQSIIDDGYQEPRFQPGIIGMLAGKIDNYRNLPQYDQAFIAKNMGYTGPTVFGENTSGLNKDPFGLNVRSAFGNYGERVGKEVTSLSEALGKSAGKRGLNFDASIGALVDASGNVIDEEDYDAKMLDFINQTKLMRTKLDFYRKKEIERNQIRKEEFDKPGGTGEQVAALNKRMQEEGVTGDKYDQAANIAGGGGGNTAKNAAGQTAREATYDNDPSTGTAQGYSQHYVRGGLVSIL